MSARAAAVEPFRVSVSDEDVADLRARLERARFADDFDNDDWSYGTNGAYLRELVDYWRDGYDWRAREQEINSFAHYRTRLDDVPIHFIHERGRGDRVVPLILTHGWPWTFWDFKDVIRPLADPASVGASTDLAFDVVVASLPGYGFSSPLRRSGIGGQQTADLWARLMTDVLGYERFGSHGGDWGSIVTAYLSHGHADKLIGAHHSLTTILGFDRTTLTIDDYEPDERSHFESWTRRIETAQVHALVNSRAPQSFGFAMNDSPIGLAAWIVERRRAWSDCDGDIERVFSKDFLLDLLSIYWFTQTFTTTARFYRETLVLHPWERRHDREPRQEAPTGYAVFPRDLLIVPRAVAARYTNLVRWTVMPRGGHFAAAEQPELLVDDLRAFFSALQ